MSWNLLQHPRDGHRALSAPAGLCSAPSTPILPFQAGARSAAAAEGLGDTLGVMEAAGGTAGAAPCVRGSSWGAAEPGRDPGVL